MGHCKKFPFTIITLGTTISLRSFVLKKKKKSPLEKNGQIYKRQKIIKYKYI